jgi:hypothetical protein
MKILKFSPPLPDKVLNWEKTITRRINDEKEIVLWDDLSLCHNDWTEFAQAIAIKVRETTFWGLTEEDFIGHEKFANEEEMYKTYKNYYHKKITPQTNLKIIEFKLTKII